MINDLSTVSEGRQPRGIVKLNGTPITGWVSWDVENNSFYQADTFRVVFASAELPIEFSANYFSSQKSISIEILAGFPIDAKSFSQSELKSLIYGNVDQITYNPVTTLIEVSGRDLTSLLIDEITTEKYPNNRAWEIATNIAEKHGLIPVITKTNSKVGVYYQIDNVFLNDQRSEWDLLTYLAHEEDFNVYVKGRELHFEPKPQAEDDPYVLQWQKPNHDHAHPIFNGESISFSRDLTIAEGVTVIVRSWNYKNKKSYEVIYPNSNVKGIKPGESSPKRQIYIKKTPNLTPEQALQKAIIHYNAIIQHEVKLEASMPADNLLMPTSIIQVKGTKTSYDQLYFPDSVRRTMDFESGYSMMVTAKNHSPENNVTI